MEVSVENTGKLERRMKVQVPAEQIDQQVQAKLEQLTRTVRLDGFRPGKVPLSVVAKRFGARVRDEATGELIASSYEAALAQEKLQPVNEPAIEQTADVPDGVLEYVATFEIYPEIALPSLDDMEIERPVAEVTEADIDRMMDKLRRQRLTWTTVHRAAQNGDRVVIDFHGTIDGEEFQGNKARRVPLELGSGSMIPGFEDQLLGATAGETRTVSVTFPENYGSKQVAGKNAQFEVQIESVAESALPEMNDDLAKTFGVDDVAMLRQEVRNNMERELKSAIRARTKDLVFDKLLEKVDLELPSSLVKSEVDALVKNANRVAEKLAGDKDKAEQEARRRVALGLLVGEIVKTNKLPLDEVRVRETIESIAASYERPEEVVNWYYGNREMLEGIKTFVMEDTVVEWITGKIKVIDKTVGFDEILNS